MNKFKLAVALLFGVTSPNAIAATTPLSQGYDSRVQLIKYNPSDVVIVRAAIGRATLIQLEDGETILSELSSGIGIGDANAWGMSVRGNNIFIKPTAMNPETNLLIVSDKGRTYSFDLITTEHNLETSYIVKFRYQKPKPVFSDNKKRVPCGDGTFNFNYVKWGDLELSPNLVWDDGRFTCFKFNTNVEQPVIYQKNSEGTEQLVNFHMEKDTVVVHGLAKEFRLRLGNSVLGIETTTLDPQGYNFKATTLVGVERVVKDE
ncbi:TrbG/VirB9 family P-type conjugative transfer protein [Vibrio vulnificus]